MFKHFFDKVWLDFVVGVYVFYYYFEGTWNLFKYPINLCQIPVFVGLLMIGSTKKEESSSLIGHWRKKKKKKKIIPILF